MPVKVYYSGTCISYNLPKLDSGRIIPQKPRHYYIKPKHKRQIISSALYAYERKHFNFCFFTLTYQADQFLANPFDHNHHITYFLDYLNEKKCIGTGYLWTKENTLRGVPHYHVLIDLKFTSVKILNKYWCNARKQEFAPNALQTDKKFGFIIRSKFGAAAYAAKYCAKGKDKETKATIYKFKSRAFAISKKWNAPTTTVSDGVGTEILHENVCNLSSKTENKYITTEFCEIFRIEQSLAKQVIESCE